MPYYMYVTASGEDKIAIFGMDPATGKLERRGEVSVNGRPAPLAIDPGRRVLHVGRRGLPEISSYRIDHGNGGLSFLATVPLETDPCFLSTDRKGKFLLSSYYEGAHVAVHPIGADGAVQYPPAEWHRTARGAHSMQTDRSNRFAFVAQIAGNGPNLILQFRFDDETGHLMLNSPPAVAPKEILGPRHFCFHPSKDILYFSNEQGCSVTGYNFDPDQGTLTPFQTISTLPEGFTGRNTCSQIQIHPSGKFLYAPNRGHNSIACFRVGERDGRLTSLGQVSSEPIPRAFSLDPEGRFLYSAGLESGRLAAFRINQATGELGRMETYEVGKAPMWVLITRLGE
jgi:6-phosphogluconolactonase